MVLDPRKRQKKKERQNARQKANKRALARAATQGIALRLQRAAGAPVLDCCTTDTLWTQGISPLLVSRRLPDGDVAAVVFLLDVYCLGVKDALCNVVSHYDYDAFRDRVLQHGRAVDLSPPCARKLVEGAVEYARDLGFAPHPDYQKARHIFGQIDPGECSRTFEYGQDGKPFFIAGPRDSSGRCRQIIATLEQRCGAGGFDFLMPVMPGDMDGLRLVSGIHDRDLLEYSHDDESDEREE